MLRDRQILLGVSGGIAAYKACELTRLLIKARAKVEVVMTENAARFVPPLTFETLSGHPVHTGMFNQHSNPLVHIELADRTELLVIAPATANIIGKIANGVADDLLTTLYLATKAKVLVCPAMNVNMYEHAAVRENLAKLKARGVEVLEPESGELACGWEGKGRLPDPDLIAEACEYLLAPKHFTGKKIMVTAGPTREALDPVRFISNRSSGKMGYALARAARANGAEVMLVSGPSALRPPLGVKRVSVESADDMRKACEKYSREADIVIMAAAVSDFRPRAEARSKIKKEKGLARIELEKTPDVIAEMGKRKRPDQILVGFAAETEELVKNAQKKLKEKNLDMIVANDVSKKGAGFDVDTNIATILPKRGRIEYLPKLTKLELSYRIMDSIKKKFF